MEIFAFGHSIVPESESRKLDNRVRMEERPYGYTSAPPAADTGDYDTSALQSKKQYKPRDRRV